MGVNEGTAGRVARRVAAGVAACAVPVLYARWGRPRLLTWGATAEEVSRSYPGDELIPCADGGVFTMATTLPAPPEQVWPWLVQMGGDRGAFTAGIGSATAASPARTASCRSGRACRWGSG
jgi:hypothetical protein